ncbi:PAS domain-containing protein [Archangium violaceum]|uniref:sensor histidine kinase n=1 Tax=Archangium violaceum TaxID=83451 RepID=UPI0019518AAE|nr:ATP-binding protein [Archangium violaceum]QRN97986.1 PAS domain-containing protein [Archangium violaceum]
MAFLSANSYSHPYRASPWARYGLALLASGLAFALQWLLWPWWAPSPVFFFLAAVIFSASQGGHGPGALSTVLSLLAIRFFFREAGPSSDAHHSISSALFTGVAALMTLICARVRLSLHEAQVARASAQANGHVLAITLRSIGDAVVTTDPNGLVRFINPVASYLCGWRELDAIGQPLERVLRLVDPSSREPLAPTSVARDEARPVQLGHQALLLSRRGGELPIEHTAAPISDSQGHRLGTVIVFRDISARFREDRERAQLLAREHDAHLEAEVQRERLETLFMQAPVAICLTRGPDHVVELVNPLGQTLVGELLSLGRTVRETVSGLDPHLVQLLDEVFRKGTPFVGHEVPLRADFSGSGRDEVKYFDLTWQPWRGVDGEILGTMGLCAEVTEQVLARREVEALASDLQQALQTRDDFLSVASHELKTPLTSLQLQLQMLRRSLPELDDNGLPHPSRKRVEASLRPAERLHQLVNNLLDVSRIRAGRLALEHETVDFASLLQDVVSRAEADAAGAGCKLILYPSPPIIGRWDRLRLEQVVTNLLSNAIKYGAHQPVEMAVIQEGSFAHLTVRDHGIGIPPESQARIFQRFERAVSERHYGGFGLGLWICKQIVDSLGGDIRVESLPGQGATFTVSLPLELPPNGKSSSGSFPSV